MFEALVDFADTLMASLVVGAMFGVWLLFNPSGLDGPTYLVLHQRGIRRLNRPLPALGAATLLLTILAAALAHGDRLRVLLLGGAAIGFLGAGLITRFLNQPINRVVMTWSTEALPSDWTGFRDRWWQHHIARLACGIAGLCAVILADLVVR